MTNKYVDEIEYVRIILFCAYFVLRVDGLNETRILPVKIRESDRVFADSHLSNQSFATDVLFRQFMPYMVRFLKLTARQCCHPYLTGC